MALILKRVDRYELLKEIGRGGMATVYLARQVDLDRNVALKELSALDSSDEAFAERFLRESRMAGSLSHPNIVTVHDYFEHDGTPYISMEYLERGSLRPLIGTLTLGQIAGVLEGLLAGLQHAASRGIVHRDIKPENVLITAAGSVKISDFGISRALNQAGEASRFLTKTGTAIGTPAYMAPEQAMAKEVGPWTDLYSLGIVAYEMIGGEVPFNDSESPMSMLIRHVSDTVPPLATVDPSIDAELSDWVDRLLEKDPAARPSDAQHAWDRLEEIVIRLLGARWRRDARLGGGDVKTTEEAQSKPLTPAPFSEEREKVEAGAGPAAPLEGGMPAASELPSAAAQAGASAPAAEPAATPLDPDESRYLTFAPGAAGKAEPPPVESAPAGEPVSTPVPPPESGPPPAHLAAEAPPEATPAPVGQSAPVEGDAAAPVAQPAAPAVAASEPPAVPAAAAVVPAAAEPAPAPAASPHVAASAPPAVDAAPAVQELAVSAEVPAPEHPHPSAADLAAAAAAGAALAEATHDPASAAATHSPPTGEPVASAAAASSPPAAAPPEPITSGPPLAPPPEPAPETDGGGSDAADPSAPPPAGRRPRRRRFSRLPGVPQVPAELQSFAPGVSEKLAQAGAVEKALPEAVPHHLVRSEIDRELPGVAGAAAEASSLAGGTPTPTRRRDARKRQSAAAGAAAAGVAAGRAAAGPTAGATVPSEADAGGPTPPEQRATIPPRRAHERPSFVLTDAVARLEQEQQVRVPRKALLAVAGFVAVAGAVAAGIIVVSGGSPRPKHAASARSTAPRPPEAQPTARERVSLAASGSSVFVALPSGSIERLSASTLKPQTATVDPAGPQTLAEARGNLVVADGQTMTTMRGADLSPISAVGLTGPVILAGGGAVPLVSLQALGAHAGRLCLVAASGPVHCQSLRFVPAGAAVTAHTVYVVDRAGSRVIPFAIGAAGVRAGTPIAVGPSPRGAPVVAGGALYVPVDRGIAVVDVAKPSHPSSIALPASPVALVRASSGRLFAALYSSNQLAILDPATPRAAPKLVATAKGPVALAVAGPAVYVVDAGSGTVRRVTAAGGAGTSSKLPSLTAHANAITVLRPTLHAAGGMVTVTVPFARGSLRRADLVVPAARIASGHAAVELWQGGISGRLGTTTRDGVTVGTRRAPGRLELALGVRAGAFTRLSVGLGASGRSVVLRLVEKPKPVPPPVTTQPSTQQPSSPSSTPPAVTTTPVQQQTPPAQQQTPPAQQQTPPAQQTPSSPPPATPSQPSTPAHQPSPSSGSGRQTFHVN